MAARTYIPKDRPGWWGGADFRRRCSRDHKVAFDSQEAAERSVAKAAARGSTMYAYKGKCGHWHLTRTLRNG